MRNDYRQTLKQYSNLLNREVQLLLDEKGTILSVSDNADGPLGVSNDLLLQRNFFEVIDPINRVEPNLETLKENKQNDIFKFNFQLKIKGQKTSYFESLMTYLKDEECFLVSAIMMGPSLFEWNFYLKTQKVAKIGGWSYDDETEEMQWSQQMYEIFDVTKCSYPHISLEDLVQLAIQQDQEKLREHFHQSLKENKPLNMRFRTLSSRLDYRWVEICAEIEFNKDIQKNYFIGTCQDITDKVQREEELEKEKNKVLHASKLSSLGEMAGNIAHEINNPLTIVMGHARKTLRLAQNNKLTPEEAAFTSERIMNAVQRMSKITQGLKAFIRKEDKTKMIKTHIQKVVEETLEYCEPRLLSNDVNLDVSIDESIQISCRQLEISQVLLNLINNAFDAIKISEEKQNHWIKIEVFQESQKAKIRISDSGIGIEKNETKQAFEAFYTTKPINVGTGLGLSIARSIIEEHHGSLELIECCAPTTFEITLPMEQQECGKKEAKQAS